MAKKKTTEDWDSEAEQNWAAFWNLILQQDVQKNPELYKKNNLTRLSSLNGDDKQSKTQKENGKNNKKGNISIPRKQGV